MCEKSLRGKQMSSAFVAEAQKWAGRLVQSESRGPGDIDNAMRRLETRYGIPYSLLYNLRYRPPRDLLVSHFARLEAAYVAECERQQRLFAHEREITKAKTRFGALLVRAADALVGESERVKE
jgi:hypothetical protein